MKRVIAALAILVCIAVISVLHMNKTITLTERIKEASNEVYEAYKKGDWNEVTKCVKKIEKDWEENHLWAYLTLSTDQIDEIEISIKQSIAYSEAEAEDDFIGEFTMMCMLIDHLPKQETFSIGELF